MLFDIFTMTDTGQQITKFFGFNKLSSMILSKTFMFLAFTCICLRYLITKNKLVRIKNYFLPIKPLQNQLLCQTLQKHTR